MKWDLNVFLKTLLFAFLGFLFGIFFTLIYMGVESERVSSWNTSNLALLYNSVISSFLTGITSNITGLATVVLAIITWKYIGITKKILDEQIKLRKIAAIEKKLEKVLNPIENALNEFIDKYNKRLKIEDKISDEFHATFSELNSKLMDVRKNYLHLIGQNISNKDIEVFKSWLLFSNEKNNENYNSLMDTIQIFHSFIIIEIKIETTILDELNFDLYGGNTRIEILKKSILPLDEKSK